MNQPFPILFFDGFCNLCNGLVWFIIRKEIGAKIKFVPLQSQTGQSLLKKFDLEPFDIDSVVYFTGDKIYLKSSAVLHILKEIGGGWSLFYGFIVIPKFIRDFFYNMIAWNRYKIFGKRNTCMVPSPDINKRFFSQTNIRNRD